jgi:hypothetical protein
MRVLGWLAFRFLYAGGIYGTAYRVVDIISGSWRSPTVELFFSYRHAVEIGSSLSALCVLYLCVLVFFFLLCQDWQ